jgi:membrane protease subunit HflC
METSANEHVARRRPLRGILWQIVVATIVVGLIVAYGSTHQVSEGHSSVVTRFGEPVRVVNRPGLKWKWPWPIETVHVIDMRYRFFNTPFTATFTRDRRNVILLSYVVWHVQDPLLFFQSLGTPEAAEQKLDGMVTAGKNYHFGRYDLTAVVSINPDNIQLDSIEQAILDDVRKPALEKFGVQVEQVGVKRIAYPEENVSAVLAQMRSERNAEAQELRAQGTKKAQGIRDEAMVRAEEILTEGRERAGEILGAAEKEAAEIYAEAHRLDPDFYRFWRSMRVIEKTLGAKATVILRNDQEPFNELFQAQAVSPQVPAERAGANVQPRF